MGLHTGFAEPAGGRVRHARRCTGRPGSPSAAHGGQVLCSGGHRRRLADASCPTTPTWSTSACTSCAASTAASGCSSWSRPASTATSPARARSRRPRTTCRPRRPGSSAAPPSAPQLRDLLGTPPAGDGRRRRAAPARPGSPSRSPATLVDEFRDGVWFVDLGAGGRPRPGRRSPSPPRSGCGPSPAGRSSRHVADHAATRASCSCWTPATPSLPAAAPLVSRLLGAGPACGCWRPAASRSACPARSSGGSRRCRVDAPAGGGPSDAVALLLDRAAAARGGRPADPATSPSCPGRATRSTACRSRSSWPPPGCGCCLAGQLADRLDDLLGTLDAGGPTTRPSSAEPRSAGTGTHAAGRRWPGPTGRSPADAARLLRWLSVFAGPVDLPAIEWLHGGDRGRPAGRRSSTSRCCRPSRGRHGGATYRMLDPIRAYAARLLVEAGEEEAARDRHVAWCAARARHDEHADADGRPVTLSLYPLDPLADELRAALHWTVTGAAAPAQGLAVAGALDQWWRERGLAREGRHVAVPAVRADAAAPARTSRTRSWPPRTTCTPCTPAPTASTASSCASRRRPRRPPAQRAGLG